MFYESAPEVEDAEPLLYRNGFVLSQARVTGYPFARWSGHRLGRFILQTHPDASCAVQELGGRTSALLGDVFDPERGIYDKAQLLKDLAGATSEYDFHEILDRLAGRFLLILARSDGGFDLYQDAMGSRTVFYATTQPVCASHSEIVGKVVGDGLSDFFIPFLTSRNYAQKATKYLPGVATPYEHVRQLTPNTRLSMPNQSVTRFWPRGPHEKPTTDTEALDALILHMRGLVEHFRIASLKPVIGLTAGTDSRLLFAAFRSSDPYLFTYIRSESGTDENDRDTRAAGALAACYGLTRDIYPVVTKPTLTDASDAFSYAYRRSTAYMRGSTALWPKRLALQNFDYADTRFVRGFGGEVLRGYYQGMKTRIGAINERQLANAYDINAGSFITRRLFRDFMDIVSFDVDSLHGRDPNDIFYWEHRMGIWGSTAMSEVDLAQCSLAGYNSRNLFDLFLALPWESRTARIAFHQATLELAALLVESPVA